MGLEISVNEKGTLVSQRKYALQLVTDFGYIGCKIVKTPMEDNSKLPQEEDENLKYVIVYMRLIRKLLYLTITRPDMSYAINRSS